MSFYLDRCLKIWGFKTVINHFPLHVNIGEFLLLAQIQKCLLFNKLNKHIKYQRKIKALLGSLFSSVSFFSLAENLERCALCGMCTLSSISIYWHFLCTGYIMKLLWTILRNTGSRESTQLSIRIRQRRK